MAKFDAQSTRLILPDGTEIAPGETVDLGNDVTKNEGVQSWIADGLLVAKSEAKAAAKSDK